MLNWQDLGEKFEKASALETLRYSVTELLCYGDVLFLTAFGPEGCVVFELLQQLKAEGLSFTGSAGKLIVANLDTGYQFKETLKLKDELETKYGFEILMIQPSFTVSEQDEKYGKDLYKTDPDQCCYMRKLVPLAELLQGKLAWITSIRRDQTEVRAEAKAFEFDKKFKLGKINPLIHWSKSDVWKFIHEHKIPYNSLLDEGYDSIGCEPCTSKGEGRAGRWAGKDKIECGLHIQDSDMEQGGEFVI